MKAILPILALFVFGYASAQPYSAKKMQTHMKEVQKSKEKKSIIWDMDTVYVSGVSYCIITEKKNGFLMPHDYYIKSLQGNDLIYIKYNSYTERDGSEEAQVTEHKEIYIVNFTTVEYYTWSFINSDKVTETEAGDNIYKMIVENNLIQGDHLNVTAEAKFIAVNGMKFSQGTNVPYFPQSSP
jgi:hypothetical protein